MKKLIQTKTKRHKATRTESIPVTFLEHVHELQVRLTWVAVAFLLASAAAYPFFDQIVAVLVKPLGTKHQLVYLTPAGAFGFIMQVCMYVGFIAALPVIIYQIYQFIMPAMQRVERKKVVLYTSLSFILALVGVSFAYFVVLPGALYFLTGLNLYHINPMLTIDSYLSFVMAYIITGALLFQLPLVLLLIDSVTPLKPSKLMGLQGHVILAAFIIAAIASPTPDVVNQTLLAMPIVIMYQFGVVLVWLKSRARKQRAAAQQEHPLALDLPDFVDTGAPASPPTAAPAPPRAAPAPQVRPGLRSMDGIRTARGGNTERRQPAGRPLPRLAVRTQPPRQGTIDGISVRG